NMQDNSGQGINDYLSDTIASVFGEVYTVNVSAGTNRELFAGNISDLPGRMAANLEKEENEELVRLMTRVSSGLSKYENKDLVMTDDKAPVELLGMKAIDGIIADEVGYYKQIYERDGIKGVIDMLFE
ncbi:MAG: spermidine synthase, partial [Lachnospiraceae bacterium]|nr:spermidine synthase [Lachnospiraceae bacterium]